MEQTTIERFFKQEEIERFLIQKRNRKLRKFAKRAAVALLVNAVIAASPLVYWWVALILLIGIWLLLFPFSVFRSRCLVVGEIVNIEHDYSIRPKKGTALWGFGAPIYRTANETYTLMISIAYTDNHGCKVTAVRSAPAEQERVFRIGDTVVYHSEFLHTMNATNLTSCVCGHCGNVQSAEDAECVQCHLPLLNARTIN